MFLNIKQLPGIIQNNPESMETKIEKQYEEFAKMVVIQMEDDISKLQFEDVDLVYHMTFYKFLNEFSIFF